MQASGLWRYSGSRAVVLLAMVVLAPGMSVWASEFSGRVTLASEYIYRGRSVSDGNPALQIGLDYQHSSGLFGGIWGSTIDLDSRYWGSDNELDVYLGYDFELGDRISLTTAVTRYTYPGQWGASYNYNQATAAATLDARHSLEFGFSDDLYGRGGTSRYWELRSEWPMANAWVVSAGLGQNDLTAYGGNRYLYWDLGASARIAWLMVDLRWYDNRPPESRIGGTSAGSRAVISLSALF